MSDLPRFWAGYEASCRDYDQQWRPVDETLYALCKAHPRHNAIGEVTAKVAIIGRTYSAGLERQVRVPGSEAGVAESMTDSDRQNGDSLVPKIDSQGEALQRVAAYMCRNGSHIDAMIGELSQLSEPSDADAFRLVLSVHGRLVQLLQGVTKKRSPRSFASKYLHFHCSVVPIYDTYAVAALQRRFAHQVVPPLGKVEGADAEFEWLIARFAHLYQEGRSAGVNPTVRLLDYFLVWPGTAP